MTKAEIERKIKDCQDVITHIAMGDRWSNDDYKIFDEKHAELRQLNAMLVNNQYEE